MAQTVDNKVVNNTAQKSYIAIITRVIMFTSLFSLLLNLTSCNQGIEMINPEVTSVSTPGTRITAALDSNATLKSVAPFPIGAAFSSGIILRSTKAYQLFTNQFNSKTVHAYMKVEPVRGQFNFQEQDYWVKLAQTNPIRLHGHVLVYHEGAPDWLLNFSGSTVEFEQVIKNHIQTVVSRYKGKIKGWDVINEIYYNSGKLRQTAFRQLYPSDEAYMGFVKRCFVWAHEADPDALLFYSDFGTEIAPAKVEAIVNMVNEFKKSGIPIHGFGSHMHITINTPDAGIVSSMRQISTTGIQVHISELDIKVNPKDDQSLIVTSQLLDKQRDKYARVATAYKQVVPVRQQYGITLWDFSDADSWIVKLQGKHDAPCIFDESYSKKPAFYGLMQGLLN